MGARKLFFYDIDGTILSTAKAGLISFLDTVEELFDKKIQRDVDFSGQTDKGIFIRLMKRYAVNLDTETAWEKFKRGYIERMKLKAAAKEGWTLHPFVRESIELVQKRGAAAALLTGNIEDCAKIKLQAMLPGLSFQTGGFADDAVHRDEIAAAALAKAQKTFNEDFHPSDVYVIGDTPKDVQCARHINVKAVAVSTGNYSYDELLECEADYTLRSLEELPYDEILK